jgi:hypothetical protein
MAQQIHFVNVGKYLFSDPCRWLAMGKCPSQLSILSEKIARSVQSIDRSIPMTEQVSPLRQRMIDDMAIRNMSPNTQKAYIRAVKNFSLHFGKSPDKLSFEDVRKYQLHLVSRGLQAATIIPIMCAIRFFYGTTLQRPGVAEHIPLARKADTLPAVLTRDQVVRFLKAVPDLEMRTIFITIYSAGLRVSEAVALTARDIDSANMVIHVRQGKGRKDRYVCPSNCSPSCAPIGSARICNTWYSPAPIPSVRLLCARCSAPAGKLSASPVSIRRSPCTRCGTVLPLICSNKASTFT